MEGWAPGFKIVGNRQGGCIHDINADQSGRGTEHLIDTTIIINLLRTSSADNPLMHFLIVMLLFPLINHSCLMIALNIICNRIKRENGARSSNARALFLRSVYLFKTYVPRMVSVCIFLINVCAEHVLCIYIIRKSRNRYGRR